MISINSVLNLFFFLTVLGYLWFSYFDLYLVPMHIYALVSAGLILISLVLFKGGFKKKFSYFPLVVILILWLFSIVSILTSKGFLDAEDLIFQLKKLIVPALIYISVGIWLGLNDKNFEFLSKTIIILVSISALVAIGQGLGIEFFWKLREKIYLNPSSPIANQIIYRERPCGLAYFAIPLTYQIISALSLTFLYLLKGKNKTIWGIILAILLGGIIVGFNRSAFFGIIIGFLYFTFKTRIKRILTLTLLIALLVGLSWQLVPKLFRIESSGYGRFPLHLVGIVTVLNNPLGVGTGTNYFKLAQKYFYLVKNLKGSGFVYSHFPHNQFINSGLYYGVLGMILVIVFYIWYWLRIAKLKSIYWEESMAFRVFIIAYLINSWFHNAGLFVGDPFSWFMIVLIEYKINRCKYE